MQNKKQVTTTLNDEEYAILQRLAELSGLTAEEYLAKITRQKLKEEA